MLKHDLTRLCTGMLAGGALLFGTACDKTKDTGAVTTTTATGTTTTPATEVAETPYSQPVEIDHADAVVDSMVVLEAMDRLSEDHREVLVEIYFHGRSVSEAAQTLGIPPGTVKSRSYYALRALRETFGSRGLNLEGVRG